MGEYYSVMMVLNFFYIAISCNVEYYQLYWNGRELILFNYRMIKCLYLIIQEFSVDFHLTMFAFPVECL